jgi:hypothetical protein
MDQIEMYWKCSACGTVNGGLSKVCGTRVVVRGKVYTDSGQGCGKPQDREEWFMPDDISKNANLVDSEDIAKATCGVDWYCAYCGSTQRKSNGECAVCGGDKESSEEDRNGKKAKNTSIHKKLLRDTSPHKETVTSNQPSYSERTLSPQYSLPPNQESRNILPFAIGGAILVMLIGFIIWLSTPRYVDAKVQSASWVGTVHVERLIRINDSGWYAPSDAEDIRLEGLRVHHYDHVLYGSHIEPYQVQVTCGQTCRSISVPRFCTSNKNGTASCSGGGSRQECSTKYCSETRNRVVNDYREESRYQMWHSWYVWRWHHNRDVQSSGNNVQVYEPTADKIALNSNCVDKEQERRSAVEFKYQCTFLGNDGKPLVYEPMTEQEFQQCTMGRLVRFKFAWGSKQVEWK